MKPDNCTSYSSQQPSYSNGTNTGSNRIRVIRLRRRNNVPLGFSVRGGREHGTGIYVSEVRAGSEAHHQGLLVGDQILRINGFNIEHAIHDEVLALLRAKPGVVIKVKSMGMIPVKDTKKDPLTWKIVEPGPTTTDFNGINSRNSSEEDSLESRISIPSIGSSGLGCSIVKGPPEVPGIYVQSVKAGSLAEKAGLQVGDRILEMNGNNFTNLDFPEAVAILKSSKQMSLVLLKGVGLDLFPEEKMRRSSHHPKQDERKLSSVQEEDSRDERNAKKMNGHNARVKNGSDPKHPKDGDLKLNGNSSCSDSDISSQQLSLIHEGEPVMKHGHSLKVCATVHSSSGDDESHNFVRKCTRESGDGMDFESLNGTQQTCSVDSWDNVKYETDHRPVCESSESSSQAHIASWEDDSCSSSHSSCRDGYKNSLVTSHAYRSNGDYSRVDKNSFTSDEKSELSSLSSDDYLGIPKMAGKLARNGYETTADECVKPPNEFLKRKQHELLMEEFREVHKKMFGHGPPKTSAKPHKPANSDFQDQASQYKRRQQMRKERVIPPPPPPNSEASSSSQKSEMHSQIIQNELEEKFYDIDDNVKKIAYRRRQREPPITDSRDLNPKPPEIYFDKMENVPKPLVTIGTYSNTNQQNRFLNSQNGIGKDHQKTVEVRQECVVLSDKCQLPVLKRNAISPCSSIAPSTSSEPRSSTSDSVLSGDSSFKTDKIHPDTTQTETEHSQETGLNSFQNSLLQFSRACGNKSEDIKKDKALPNKSEKGVSLPKHSQQNSQNTDPGKENIMQSLEREADGRVIKRLVLKKSGPLNFTVEGGINSDLAGKIIVSDVWTGSCAIEGGTIEPGDQILMVDNTRLTGLSLIAANVALRNANSNASKEMTLVIAKSLQKPEE